MGQTVAEIYEIDRKIGAGGGGIVYLGRHQRLDKQVVLKADKRTLKAGKEKLRREVDMLKNLRHTYIPQVYDFIQENGIVYTVMDYIEGESLDKYLAAGRIPSQPELIRWACQLLEALDYLHNRPPHGILHGDIKPANIMRKPDGDICLIDFNIALALGEDGAVKAGLSRGYASPEHYNADYLTERKQIKKTKPENEKTQAETQIETRTETKIEKAEDAWAERSKPRMGFSGSGNSTGGHTGSVLLDARSDIYSLGATLYHLLSGHRPPQDAREVEMLGRDVCSEEVAAIIQKAMSPLPQDRYQSAQEMLNAFRRLHRNDKRVRRHKRHIRAVAAGIAGTFLTGGFLTITGMKQMKQVQSALTLAEYSADALAQGDTESALRQALQAIPDRPDIWSGPVTAQAQKALTDALGVYDLSDGYKGFGTIDLPSAPFRAVFSPAGTYLAVGYAYETAVYRLENLKRIVLLPMQESALADCIFTDETHLLYAGENGIALYDIEKKSDVWSGMEAAYLAVSADGKTAAAVDRDAEYAVMYRVQDGEKLGEVSFYGQHMPIPVNDTFADFKDNVFTLNEDGSLLAVSFDGGGFSLFHTKDSSQDMILYEKSEYKSFSGGFSGNILALTMQSDTESVFTMIDTRDGQAVGGYSSQDALLVQADENGIYLAEKGIVTWIDTDSMTEKEIAYIQDSPILAYAAGKEYTIAAAEDQTFAFFDSGANCMSKEESAFPCEFVSLAGEYALTGSRSEPKLRLMKLENHETQQLLHYDARYEHEEARMSGDGQSVMLFGLKSFRIYGRDGNMISEVMLPDADLIYDQQFRREADSSYLEVIWYDGMVRKYSASNGELLEQVRKERPKKDLYEEFETNSYRIESPLHGTPQVYKKDSNIWVGELKSEDYLTYVTEQGDYLITEYIDTTGSRYGLLLNHDLEKLAYLPHLCDVTEDGLIFDYGSGNLRQCRLYSLQELIALGENYIEEMKK